MSKKKKTKKTKQGVISRGLKPVAFINPDVWKGASDEEKQAAVDKLNKMINDERAKKGLPPLPKGPPDEEV